MDSINFTLVLAQLANFGILFLLFKKFIADKLIATIQQRRELQARLELAAQNYEKNMAQAEADKQAILEQARHQAKNMMIEIEALANQKSVDIILAAEKQAELELQWARRQLEKERISMLAQMKSKIVDISLRLNEKLFDDAGVDRKFMEQEMKGLKI